MKQAINSNNGLNVNGQAMNFYWQHTPQARRVRLMAPRPLLLGTHSPHLPGFP